MSSEDLGVNPGPLNPRILYDQTNHVSDNIWTGTERSKLKNIGSNAGFDGWTLTDRQQQYVRNAGFGFCLDASNIIRTDVGFLNAMIERWRPETNTFHLPIGECTITLEDVWMIFGVPVQGEPITGELLKGFQAYHFSQGLKRDSFPRSALTSSGIRLSWLTETYGVLPKGYTEEEEVIATRAFLLFCIGKVLLPCSTKSCVHAKYLRFVEDLDSVNKYSWGSGMLANTYRQLYKASRKEVKTFSGCHILIQVWAWERMTLATANPRPKSEDWLPRVTAYRYGKKNKYDKRRDEDNINHTSVVFYRGELDIYHRRHGFKWTPYSRFYQGANGQQLMFFRDLGRSRVPLIHFEMVEYQLPERVLRQFGLLNEIPVDPPRFDDLRTDKEDFERVDASTRYAGYVAEWGNMVMAGLNAIIGNTIERLANHEEYMNWYSNITRRRISRAILNPPRGKYHPRELYAQDSGYKVMELGVSYHVESIGLIPPSHPRVHEIAQSLQDAYTSHTQEFKSPDFVYPPIHKYSGSTGDGDTTFDSQMKSFITNLFQTPSQPPESQKSNLVDDMSMQAPPAPMKEKGNAETEHHHYQTPQTIVYHRLKNTPTKKDLSKQAPPAPMKDKGKGKMEDGQYMFSGPDFDLGIDWSESQGLGGDGARGAGYNLQQSQVVDNEGIGYESNDFSLPLDDRVKAWVDENWFKAEGTRLNEAVKVGREGNRPISELKCLSPGQELWDSIVSGYVHLLLEREGRIPRRHNFWVADCLFMMSCELEWNEWCNYIQDGGQPDRWPFSRSVTRALEGSDGLQPSVKSSENLLIPFLCTDIEGRNHFSIFTTNLTTYTLVIVDSAIKRKDMCLSAYNRQINIMFEYLPHVLNVCFGMSVPIIPFKNRRIVLKGNTPRQRNHVDCGVYVAKTVDWILQGVDKLPKDWTQQQVDHWRYWMAWEIKNDRARG